MQAISCPYPPCIVGITSSDLGRYIEFAISLERLLVPKGSRWKWMRGTCIAANRNIIARELFTLGGEQFRWAFFLDDDHIFDPDLLMRLLKNEVSIVQALTPARTPPYRPHIYYHDKTGVSYQSALEWNELPEGGLVEADGTCAGGLLVSRSLLENMPDPWFEEGKLEKDKLGEDLYFNQKALALGYKTYVDLDARMGHIGSLIVWPERTDRWFPMLRLAHDTYMPFIKGEAANAKR